MTGISCRDIYAQLDQEYIEAEVRLLDDATFRGGDLRAFANITGRVMPVRMEVEYSELVQVSWKMNFKKGKSV
jgi:hypothetical protein